MKIQYVIAIHLIKWLTKFYDFRFKWTATAAIGIHPTKTWLSQLVNFKNAIWTLRRTICNKIVFWTWKKCQRMECLRLLLDYLAWSERQFLSGIRDSRKTRSLWGMMRGVGGVRKSIHRSCLAKGLGLGIGLLCWGFKGVQEEIPSEGASTLQIRSVAFPPGQCTSLELHPCHRLFDQDGHQDSSSVTLPILHTLFSVTFGYSLRSEAVVMRQLRRWKRLWRRSFKRSHKRTSMGPSRSCWNGTTSALQPKEITLKWTRVSNVYYQ